MSPAKMPEPISVPFGVGTRGKRDLRILVGLLTGHNWLNRHMSVMGLRENPNCPLCDVRQVPCHYGMQKFSSRSISA